jgi:hypothetical protein
MISILIPTYNYNTLPLVEEIYSQVKLTGVKFEIIVIEDGSPRNEISEKNSKINTIENCLLVRNETNIGRTKTRLLLSQKAKYNWLLFLDADVIPVNKNFIKSYISMMSSEYSVVLGGYQYKESTFTQTSILRYKYGKNIEEKNASIRNNQPYQYVFSGNILITKDLFSKNNFNGDTVYYGMDVYFSYQLFINKIKVLHIDNPIYHLGLETNEIFFNKSLDSVTTKKIYLSKLENIEKINSLIKYYLLLKKYKLTGVIAIIFKATEPFLKRMIFKKNPNLLCFDLYRLGYICK